MPTRSQIIGAGGLPYPTQYQYTHPWHLDGKGAQPGAKMMIDNGAEVHADGTWMQSPGYAMSFRQVPVRPAVETSNSFAALSSEEPDEPLPPGPTEQTPEKPIAMRAIPRKCCGSKSVQCQHGSGPGCRTFLEKRTQSLRPLESKWESSLPSLTVVPV